MNEKLKPCPFCARKATFCHDEFDSAMGGHCETFMIRCKHKKSCPMFELNELWFDTKGDTLKWNERPRV